MLSCSPIISLDYRHCAKNSYFRKKNLYKTPLKYLIFLFLSTYVSFFLLNIEDSFIDHGWDFTTIKNEDALIAFLHNGLPWHWKNSQILITICGFPGVIVKQCHLQNKNIFLARNRIKSAFMLCDIIV